MSTVRINADRVSWLVKSPYANQPPVSVVAEFGDVVDIPDEEAKRLRGLSTRRFYTDPVTGVPNSLARMEPTVVDADANDKAEAEARTSIDAEVAELQARIVELQANRPPSLAPSIGNEASQVILSPATTGTRVLPAEGSTMTAAEAAAAGVPAPLISAEDRASALAEGRDPQVPSGEGTSGEVTSTTEVSTSVDSGSRKRSRG